MKNQMLKVTDEIAKKLKDLFATPDFQKEMLLLKDVGAEDNGTFRMVISTDDVDRHGEIVSQDGWQTENYMKNAVVLWGHDSYAIPVGITDKLITEISGSRKSTIAEGRFAGHEFAQTLRKLYDAGMLKASSVGFIPLEYNGNIITKAELLEWSFVSIPANPFALDTAKKLGLDVGVLLAKGFLKDMKEGEEVNNDAPVKCEHGNEAECAQCDATKETEATEDGEVEEATVTNSDDEKSMTLTLSDGSKKKFKLTDKFFEGFEKLIEARVEKAGRVISKSNLEKITSARDALEAVIELASSEQEDDKGIDGSESIDAQNEVKEAEDFLTLRKGVQGIATQLIDILTDAKKTASKKGIDVRYR